MKTKLVMMVIGAVAFSTACGQRENKYARTIWVGDYSPSLESSQMYHDDIVFRNDSLLSWKSGYNGGLVWDKKYRVSHDTLFIESLPKIQYGYKRELIKMVQDSDALNIVYYAQEDKNNVFKSHPLNELKVPIMFHPSN